MFLLSLLVGERERIFIWELKFIPTRDSMAADSHGSCP